MRTRLIHPTKTRNAAINNARGLAVILWLLTEFGPPIIGSFPHSFFKDFFASELSPSRWNGATGTDLVVPLFLFAMGAAAAHRIADSRAAGLSLKRVFADAIRKSAVLAALGLVCGGILTKMWQDVQYVGVFQRLAICHIFVIILASIFNWKTLTAIASSLVLYYWAALEWVDLPISTGEHYSVDSNLAAYLDPWLIGGQTYFGTWDPNGLVTTLPALSVSLSGAVVGKLTLSSSGEASQRRMVFGWSGAIGITLGLLWQLLVPLNAHLWTPPFVALATGICLLQYALFSWPIRPSRSESPLQSFAERFSGAISLLGRHSLASVLIAATLVRASEKLDRLRRLTSVHLDLQGPAFQCVVLVVVLTSVWWMDRHDLKLRL